MSGPPALTRRMIGALRRFPGSSGGSMLIAYTIVTLIMRLASNMVLTRLLEPVSFGILGVITSVTTILAMLSDFGFASFIVRHEKGADPKFLDVIWTIRLAQSSVQMVILLAGAIPIALLLGKPAMAKPIAECAPLFVLNALCPMVILVAQRQGKVRQSCAIELGALGAQIAMNLLLTLVIRDYRALVIGLYVNSVARMALTMLILREPSRLRFDRGVAREFFGFSRIIMASSLVTLLLSQSDKVIFARLFSLADFGVYMLAANLALSVQPFGRNYVQFLFFPLVARSWRESRAELNAVFYTARRRIYPLLFTGIGAGIGIAPLLFSILFDHRYQHGWVFLSVLLLRSALDLDSCAGTQTLLAIGRTWTNLYANLLRAIGFVVALLLLHGSMGAISLPLALVAAEVVATVYANIMLARLGLFRVRSHAVYYVVLVFAIGAAAAISFVTEPQLMRTGLTAVHP